MRVAERPKLALVRKVEVDRSRDALLTDFGKTTLEDRYLLPGESYQDMFARVSTAFADDADHAQRVYDYMSKLWFMPSTPVLSNGGAERGLPISCFLNAVSDSLDGILGVWNENVWLAANGGGIGTYWGGVRSIGEKVKGQGQTSGIIPFIRVMDSLTLAISQGSLRRGSAAVYLDIHHPEIEEFLEIRKASGDFNRKSLNLHHGISITDEFMHAVRDGHKFGLRSPKTNEVLREVDARALWQKVLELRLQTGEPYLIFSDTVNRAMPQHQQDLGLKVRQSNLCSEIMLHTGVDHLGNDRTAVCCLSSVNAETFLEWRDHPMFIEDIMRFLDNVLQDFIDRAPDAAATAAYAAMRERSVGLGLMGFHSFLQSQNVPFESALAKSWNMRMFKHLRREADKASITIGEEKGPCPDAADRGSMERFSHKLAIAPTASISIICGGTSAGIEPIPANIYTHKTLSGSFAVKNPYLEKLLEEKGQNTDAVWGSILENEGSVQHLDFLSQDDKDVYKTAFELDQRWVVELAADRTPEICQSQSVNIFLPGDVDKWDLHMLHWQAWERGVKSLYYLRSKSVQRAAYAGSDVAVAGPANGFDAPSKTDYEECLACQ
ncbi:ribonucleoside-diphosphate reductase subunit alpha [Caulobacter soli]|uniref:ribonucleoside-diphosphate reductase subunit alpha n=1 Tax=Caulobacter soli TaxID=2708539 RepID=UPI003CCCE99D